MRKIYFFLFLALCFTHLANAQMVAALDYIYTSTPISANAIIGNVLSNDYFNNAPVDASQVIVTEIGSNPDVQLLPDGSVKALHDFTLESGATFYYEVCDMANPNNCSTSYFDLWVVSPAPPFGPAPTLTVLEPPTCNHPFATIQLSNFPYPAITTWIVWLGNQQAGFEYDGYQENSEDVIIENVPVGLLTLSVEDIIDGIRSSVTQFYLPHPSCELNLTFNGTLVDTNANSITDAGDAIDYQFTVTNDGSVPLTNVYIDSPTLTVQGTAIPLMAVGATDTTSFTATHVLTQDEIHANTVEHIATVYGTDGSVTRSDSYNVTTALQIPDGFKMVVFFDYNMNGIMDNNEQAHSSYFNIGTFDYEVNNDGQLHHISTSNTSFTFYETNPLNTYHLSLNLTPDYAAYYQSTTEYNITVAAGSGITTYYFPVSLIPHTDLKIWLDAPSLVRPGFPTTHKIRYVNIGNVPVSGTISYTPDSRMTITNTSVPVTAIPGGFTFAVNNLYPNDTQEVTVALQVLPSPAVNIGDSLTSTATSLNPNASAVQPTHTATKVQAVNSSYDPNDITEARGPQILHSSFSSADYLTYTIRFENTGNAEAINIEVDHLLDGLLDENTIRVLDASHNYVMERVGNNLTWTFGGINLDPSVEGTDIGKGYIVFEVKPKPGYAVGDIIPASASIYFDFNPAIVTETFHTEFVSALATKTFETDAVKVYPNPTKNTLHITRKNTNIQTVTVTDMLGKTVLSATANRPDVAIDLGALAKGMYLVKIRSGNSMQTFKVIRE
ncbi:T9SS type A sorting domain-containing protein [Flavobacterium sp.]|uniref:T9SS type A sorting domain-containing protein n=1 Tax=Flavobacterium sp. TaxID=239 RepID=UPI0039E592C5